MRKVYFLLLVGCLFFIFTGWIINLWFNESLYTTKGSFKYFLSVPPCIIMSFPNDGHVGPVNYHYSAGDGPAPESYALSYDTTLNENVIRSKVVSFVLKNAYFRNQQSTGSSTQSECFINSRGDIIELWIGKRGKSSNSSVSITFSPKGRS
jgi:hypothetical protein